MTPKPDADDNPIEGPLAGLRVLDCTHVKGHRRETELLTKCECHHGARVPGDTGTRFLDPYSQVIVGW